MRIACVDNLSAYAFSINAEAFPGSIEFVTPAESTRLAAAACVDAALVPSAALDRLPGMQPVPFGIACEGAVTSVMFCSQIPLGALIREKASCSVPVASVTSRALMRQLCQRAYGAAPLLVEGPFAPARILMGDDAADLSRTEHGWPFIIDLGQWWFQLTQLPFVYAQWVVRKDLSLETKTAVAKWLEDCAGHARTPGGIARLVQRATSRGFFGTSALQAQHYYLRLRNQFGAREFAGLEEFLKMEKGAAAWARIA